MSSTWLCDVEEWLPGRRMVGGRSGNLHHAEVLYGSSYTGLRISDASTFDMERVKGNDCFLRMHKTGKPLFTWLPDELVQRMEAQAIKRGARPFMVPSGSTRMES